VDKSTIKNAKLYRSVDVASLTTGRRGKHHDLMEGIIRELRMLKEGSALEIPLASVDGVEMANLRSAVHRAATQDGVNIQTKADKKNLYVWIRQQSELIGGAGRMAEASGGRTHR
jgi:hypothetical protein